MAQRAKAAAVTRRWAWAWVNVMSAGGLVIAGVDHIALHSRYVGLGLVVAAFVVLLIASVLDVEPQETDQ